MYAVEANVKFPVMRFVVVFVPNADWRWMGVYYLCFKFTTIVNAACRRMLVFLSSTSDELTHMTSYLCMRKIHTHRIWPYLTLHFPSRLIRRIGAPKKNYRIKIPMSFGVKRHWVIARHIARNANIDHVCTILWSKTRTYNELILIQSRWIGENECFTVIVHSVHLKWKERYY